jgi:hypothetical protein
MQAQSITVLVAATMLATTIFAVQLVTSWRLLAVIGEPKLWQESDATHRMPHWYAAFGSAAFGVASVVGAFLLWTLS